MPWTVSYAPPSEPALLDRYLLVCGRTMCLAASLESKLDHCIRVLRIKAAVDSGVKGQALDTIARSPKMLKSVMIGEALDELKNRGVVNAEQLAVLDAGRVSRNHMAHVATALNAVYALPRVALESKLANLRPHVLNLAMADNLVSAWVYTIESSDNPPAALSEDYVALAEAWVLG